MNYSENPGMVRVDYFKPSGKWYMTEAVDMSAWWGKENFIFDAVTEALKAHWEARHNGRPEAWRQFTVVILKSYHEYAYPIMLKAVEA